MKPVKRDVTQSDSENSSMDAAIAVPDRIPLPPSPTVCSEPDPPRTRSKNRISAAGLGINVDLPSLQWLANYAQSESDAESSGDAVSSPVPADIPLPPVASPASAVRRANVAAKRTGPLEQSSPSSSTAHSFQMNLRTSNKKNQNQAKISFSIKSTSVVPQVNPLLKRTMRPVARVEQDTGPIDKPGDLETSQSSMETGGRSARERKSKMDLYSPERVVKGDGEPDPMEKVRQFIERELACSPRKLRPRSTDGREKTPEKMVKHRSPSPGKADLREEKTVSPVTTRGRRNRSPPSRLPLATEDSDSYDPFHPTESPERPLQRCHKSSRKLLEQRKDSESPALASKRRKSIENSSVERRPRIARRSKLGNESESDEGETATRKSSREALDKQNIRRSGRRRKSELSQSRSPEPKPKVGKKSSLVKSGRPLEESEWSGDDSDDEKSHKHKKNKRWKRGPCKKEDSCEETESTGKHKKKSGKISLVEDETSSTTDSEKETEESSRKYNSPKKRGKKGGRSKQKRKESSSESEVETKQKKNVRDAAAIQLEIEKLTLQLKKKNPYVDLTDFGDQEWAKKHCKESKKIVEPEKARKSHKDESPKRPKSVGKLLSGSEPEFSEWESEEAIKRHKGKIKLAKKQSRSYDRNRDEKYSARRIESPSPERKTKRKKCARSPEHRSEHDSRKQKSYHCQSESSSIERPVERLSPKRTSLDMTPKRTTKEHTPKRKSAERTLKKSTSEWTPKRRSIERTPKKSSLERTPKRKSRDRTPKRESMEKSSKHGRERTPGRSSEKTQRKDSFERTPKHGSANKSSLDRTPKRRSREQTPKRESVERTSRRKSKSSDRIIKNSTRRNSTEWSPKRFSKVRSSLDRTPKRKSIERSPRLTSNRQSSERSPKHRSTDWSPEKKTLERTLRKRSLDGSPERNFEFRCSERRKKITSPVQTARRDLFERVSKKEDPDRMRHGSDGRASPDKKGDNPTYEHERRTFRRNDSRRSQSHDRSPAKSPAKGRSRRNELSDVQDRKLASRLHSDTSSDEEVRSRLTGNKIPSESRKTDLRDLQETERSSSPFTLPSLSPKSIRDDFTSTSDRRSLMNDRSAKVQTPSSTSVRESQHSIPVVPLRQPAVIASSSKLQDESNGESSGTESLDSDLDISLPPTPPPRSLLSSDSIPLPPNSVPVSGKEDVVPKSVSPIDIPLPNTRTLVNELGLSDCSDMNTESDSDATLGPASTPMSLPSTPVGAVRPSTVPQPVLVVRASASVSSRSHVVNVTDKPSALAVPPPATPVTPVPTHIPLPALMTPISDGAETSVPTVASLEEIPLPKKVTAAEMISKAARKTVEPIAANDSPKNSVFAGNNSSSSPSHKSVSVSRISFNIKKNKMAIVNPLGAGQDGSESEEETSQDEGKEAVGEKKADENLEGVSDTESSGETTPIHDEGRLIDEGILSIAIATASPLPTPTKTLEPVRTVPIPVKILPPPAANMPKPAISGTRNDNLISYARFEDRRQSRSPIRNRSYSYRRSLSPRRGGRRRTPSPRRRTPSPRRRTPSPRKRTPSPRRRTPSPRRRTPTPRRRTPSPRRRTPSPRRRTPSPRRRTPSPRRRTPSPRRRTPSPRRRWSPRRSPDRRWSDRRSAERRYRRSPSLRSRRRRSLSRDKSRRRCSPDWRRSPERRRFSPDWRRYSPPRRRSRSPIERRRDSRGPESLERRRDSRCLDLIDRRSPERRRPSRGRETPERRLGSREHRDQNRRRDSMERRLSSDRRWSLERRPRRESRSVERRANSTERPQRSPRSDEATMDPDDLALFDEAILPNSAPAAVPKSATTSAMPIPTLDSSRNANLKFPIASMPPTEPIETMLPSVQAKLPIAGPSPRPSLPAGRVGPTTLPSVSLPGIPLPVMVVEPGPGQTPVNVVHNSQGLYPPVILRSPPRVVANHPEVVFLKSSPGPPPCDSRHFLQAIKMNDSEYAETPEQCVAGELGSPIAVVVTNKRRRSGDRAKRVISFGDDKIIVKAEDEKELSDTSEIPPVCDIGTKEMVSEIAAVSVEGEKTSDVDSTLVESTIKPPTVQRTRWSSRIEASQAAKLECKPSAAADTSKTEESDVVATAPEKITEVAVQKTVISRSPSIEPILTRFQLSSSTTPAESSGDSTPTQSSTSPFSKPAEVLKPGKVKSRWLKYCEMEGLMPEPIVAISETDSEKADEARKKETSDKKLKEELPPESELLPEFETIAENIFLSGRRILSKEQKEAKRMVCDCTTSKEERADGIQACGDDCLNRLLMIECSYRCPCGKYCTNRQFQECKYSGVEPFRTEWKGWGLKAFEPMKSGAFVMEYIGEVLDYKQFKRRTKKYKDGPAHYYFMALNADEVIDATYKGNVSRFINHSCDPNCETQKWTVNGDIRIGFFAIKDIKEGEELTFDYKFERYGQEAQKCFCGSANCRGFIGTSKTYDSKTAPSPSKAKKERKDKVFIDTMLDEAIVRLQEDEGPRKKSHIIDLARLMVNAESQEHRIALLDLLQKITDTDCLRLFLDYHGLSLMRSWMADVNCSHQLKINLLNSLKILPITNRTILEDTKIFSLVCKWAEVDEAQYKRESKDSSQEDERKKVSSPLPGKLATDSPTAKIVTPTKIRKSLQEFEEFISGLVEMKEEGGQEEKKIEVSEERVEVLDEKVVVAEEEKKADEKMAEDIATIDANVELKTETDLVNIQTTEVKSEIETEVSKTEDEKAGNLKFEETEKEPEDVELKKEDCEKDDTTLFEVSKVDVEKQFDISQETISQEIISQETISQEAISQEAISQETISQEAISQETISQEAISQETDSKNDNSSSESEQKSVKDEEVSKDNANDRASLDSDHEQDVKALALHLLEKWSKLKEAFRIPKKQLREDRIRNERELERKYRRGPERGIRRDSVDRSKRRLSTEDEERHREESRIKQPEPVTERERWARKKQKIETSKAGWGNPAPYKGTFVKSQSERKSWRRGRSASPPDKLSKRQRRELFEAQVKEHDEAMWQMMPIYAMGLTQEQMQQWMQYGYNPSTGEVVPVTPMYDPNIDPAQQYQLYQMMQMQQGALIQHGAMSVGTPAVGESPMIQPMQTPILTDVPDNAVPMVALDGQIVYQVAAAPEQARVDPRLAAVEVAPAAIEIPAGMCPQQSLEQRWEQITGPVVESQDEEKDDQDDIPKPPPPRAKPKSPKLLPAGWKKAKDEFGTTYYYHKKTRRTQWEPPTSDNITQPSPSSEKAKRKSKRKAEAAEADSSTEDHRQLKEAFRKKMSEYVVNCLNPFRKPDCKLGRITSTEDFKHLARKLTHAVMAKELKHCRHLEDLEVNENVRFKTKEFVKKYMARFGIVYKAEGNSPIPDS